MKKVVMMMAVSVCMLFLANVGFAQAPPSAGASPTLGQLASTATESATGIIGLMQALAFIAGLGFVIGGIVKLKAHKDTPTQVPISTGIVWLFLGAALLFLPTLIKAVGTTIFGSSSAQMTDYLGTTILGSPTGGPGASAGKNG